MGKKPKDSFDFSATDGLDGLDTGDDEVENEQVPEAQPEAPVDDQVEEYSEDPDEMSEEEIDLEADVSERLAVAHNYGALLTHNFFPEQSKTTKRIQRELRGFVQQRLKALLGMPGAGNLNGGGGSGPAFSGEDESALRRLIKNVDALEALAERLVKAASRPPVATIAQVQVQPPRLQSALKPAPVAAQIRQVGAPAPVRTVPQAKPVQAPAQAAPRPAQKPAAPTAAPVKKPGASAPKPPLERVHPAYRNDPTLRSVNGQWFVDSHDDDGNVRTILDPRTKKLKPLTKNVTIQVPAKVGPQPLPTPSIDMSNAMAAQADAAGAQRIESAFGALTGRGGLLQAVTNRITNNNEEEEERP